MKLKLTRSEFEALFKSLDNVVNQPRPRGIQAVAIHGLLNSLWKKFYLRAAEKRNKYSVQISDEQACAFYLYFTRVDPDTLDMFTANVINQLTMKIHQQFS
ncbi:MAG: hypothetical protein J0M30_14675 [Chitinophagales bacterium]|nr:hypothetical protein [Chitinophagales bacterium]